MESKKSDFGFNIQRILDCGFQIEEAIEANSDNTLISYGMGFYFDIEESWVQYNLRADFIKDKKQIFASGTVLTKFGIQNLKQFANENGDILWPPNTLETMFGIAFNHLRAMVAKNMAGTSFSNYIIPLVNPAFMFKQLIEKNPMYDAEQLKNIEHESEKRTERQIIEKHEEIKNKKKRA